MVDENTLKLFRVITFMMRATNAAVGDVADAKSSLKALEIVHQVANGDIVLFHPDANDNEINSDLNSRDQETATLVLQVLTKVATAAGE